MTTAPANASLLDDSGQITQAWRQYLSRVGTAVASVGDYLQTVRTDLGNSWLLCDGSSVSQTDYPALYALLKSITAPSSTAGMFLLPTIAGVRDPTNPGSAAPPVLQTWIRAK